MSFLAKLKIDGTTYNVMEADYSITQPDDGTGLPSAKTVGGKIFLKVESDKSTALIDWAMSNSERRSGTLVFYNRDSVSTFRNIAFSDAYCLKFRELFSHANSEPLYAELTIAAKTLDIKGSKFENDWPLLR